VAPRPAVPVAEPTTPPQVEAPADDPLAFAVREGFRFGLGGGAFYLFRPRRYADVRPIESALGTAQHGGGGYLEAVVSSGISPEVDLRIVPRLALGSVPLEWTFSGTVKQSPDWNPYAPDGSPQENTFSVTPSALVALRLNLTAVYSMMLGLRAGAELFAAAEQTVNGEALDSTLVYSGTQSPSVIVLPHWGPELSLLNFSFGAKRELEIECWQGLLIAAMPSFHLGLGVRYLVLP
jgi:hypothetical protein